MKKLKNKYTLPELYEKYGKPIKLNDTLTMLEFENNNIFKRKTGDLYYERIRD